MKAYVSEESAGQRLRRLWREHKWNMLAFVVAVILGLSIVAFALEP